MVTTLERACAMGFADTVSETVPGPWPAAPAVMEIHGASVRADQAQPALSRNRYVDASARGGDRLLRSIEAEGARCGRLSNLEPQSVDDDRAAPLADHRVAGRRVTERAVTAAGRVGDGQPVHLAARFPRAFAVGADDDGTRPARRPDRRRLSRGGDRAARARRVDRRRRRRAAGTRQDGECRDLQEMFPITHDAHPGRLTRRTTHMSACPTRNGFRAGRKAGEPLPGPLHEQWQCHVIGLAGRRRRE